LQWATVFIFDLANQRLPESVQEDLANKPWRPIPTGKVNSEQTRRGMLIAIPLVLALNTILGVWKETALIFILTWLYNDLKGGDEVIRDLIISVAFGIYNHASLKLAVDAGTEVTQQGYIWIALISGVILTTMQVQDLKDQAGDEGRNRRTIPLVFGDSFSRWSIAGLVLLWSPICVFFWRLNLWAYVLPMAIGTYLAFQVLWKRDPKADAKAWRLWCVWMMVLYVLPVIHCSQTVTIEFRSRN
jgi:4-hydroxybenzoate polyprenyltransferase